MKPHAIAATEGGLASIRCDTCNSRGECAGAPERHFTAGSLGRRANCVGKRRLQAQSEPIFFVGLEPMPRARVAVMRERRIIVGGEFRLAVILIAIGLLLMTFERK
ncbi:hypothetical protein [Bradyrhizobium sp. 62]|uniref:hypothetical protein n=1 Tax=Bradyrhizobium sp. 62 TaxID=1043588 RepID=UPI001FF97D49|nr:hypothetical protein [Bradyrhizobium sp. 62]MCK1366887.1 hypothetical protein [Bradyrhizobium sp. 62]